MYTRSSVSVAREGEQLRNRMPNQTCLHRRAGVQARDGNEVFSQHCRGKSRGKINTNKIN